jgi:tetratricopeptide (TPR) repeat protein
MRRQPGSTSGQPEQAALKHGDARDPGHRAAVEAEARRLSRAGRRGEAAALLRRDALHSEGRSTCDLALAEAFYAAELEEEAEAACRPCLERAEARAGANRLLARILQGQNRLDEAEAALRSALACEPGAYLAHRELAQLVWMRTGSSDLALAALHPAPPSPALAALTVRILEESGRPAEAYSFAAKAAEAWPALHLVAAKVAVAFDPECAAGHMRRLGPHGEAVARAKADIEIDLALGHGEDAGRRAEALRRMRPGDHYVTALLATAWRLAGDPRYPWLYNYDRLVSVHRPPTPAGWPTQEAYLHDLAAALDAAHGAPLTHPLGQSLRHGSQTYKDLRAYPAPAIQALFPSIDGPIRERLAAVGGGGYDLSGAWSVRLGPMGHHIDHVHAEGWLSSAFYVRLPKALEGLDGALRLGQPGPRTLPALGPERHIRPEPGVLVLFPAYMWHGTMPFGGAGDRLSCAFDIVRRRLET